VPMRPVTPLRMIPMGWMVMVTGVEVKLKDK